MRERAAQSKLPIKHVWHEDTGFKISEIRNKAVAQATGEYLIFIDGDCIPSHDFVRRHAQLAEKGYFVGGSRCLLEEDFSRKVQEENHDVNRMSVRDWLRVRKERGCNRWLPKLRLRLGPLRYLRRHSWKGARTANLAMWRDDFIKVNGFDESFTGWGFDDSDMLIRVMRTGVERKDGRFGGMVYHLWHPIADRSQEEKNRARLEQVQKEERINAVRGIDQYL